MAVAAAAAGCGPSAKRSNTGGVAYVRVPTRAAHTDLVDAYDILHHLGLRVELGLPTPISALVTPGAKLTPPPGTRLLVGSVVTIAPTPAAIGSPAVLKSHPHYRVPDFSGRPLSSAVRWAELHDMFWAVPYLPAVGWSNAPHLFDAYYVLGQKPRPGGTIVQGVMVGGGFRPTPLTLTVAPRGKLPTLTLDRASGGPGTRVHVIGRNCSKPVGQPDTLAWHDHYYWLHDAEKKPPMGVWRAIPLRRTSSKSVEATFVVRRTDHTGRGVLDLFCRERGNGVAMFVVTR